MKPPLRSEDDRRAMVEGLASGDIDVIVSAHEPRGAEGKRSPFAEAADGAVGIEAPSASAVLLQNGLWARLGWRRCSVPHFASTIMARSSCFGSYGCSPRI